MAAKSKKQSGPMSTGTASDARLPSVKIKKKKQKKTSRGK
jgi:hypothetical protein